MTNANVGSGLRIHPCQGKSIPAFDTYGLNRGGGQPWVFSHHLYKGSDALNPFVIALRVGHLTVTYHIVANDQRTGAGVVQCPAQIGRVIRLSASIKIRSNGG